MVMDSQSGILRNVIPGPTPNAAGPKLLDRLRDKLRVLYYAWKTDKAYVARVEMILRFHEERTGTWKHPTERGKTEIELFLTHFAVEEHGGPRLIRFGI